MPHLYELSAQMKGLQKLVDSGDMSADDLVDTIDGLTGDLMAKGGDVCSLWLTWQATSPRLKAR